MASQEFTTYQEQKLSQGTVTSSAGPLFSASGLAGAKIYERVVLETGSLGFVFTSTKESTDIVLISGDMPSPGVKVIRTNEEIAFPVSNRLLGAIVNPLGIDYSTHNHHKGEMQPIEHKAAGIKDREKITKQCLTGSLLVDTLLPLGKGQRELLLGDRKTGKTQFALETLITQTKAGSIGIYVSIGKPLSSVKALRALLEEHNCSDKVVIIASSPEDPAGLIYLTPFSGMRLAEYFRDLGHDVLIVLDDLTTHARAYRQLSLLARRFPGRNAYPGDIFYLHARLLERAGNFRQGDGKTVSITALPIAETELGDLTGYIQTNIMSMTDGHLYFDEERFLEGIRPAVHPFISVTRVGRQTKSAIEREAISSITSFLSQAERLAQISHFGQELSSNAKQHLQKADKFNLLFTLPLLSHYSEDFQFFIISLVWGGYWLTSRNDTLLTDLHRLHTLFSKNEAARSRITKIHGASTLTQASTLARETADQLFTDNP